MLFNSIEFIFLFLPFFLVIFYIAPIKLRLAVIFLFSLVFYSAEGKIAVAVFLVSLFWSYITARLFKGSKKKSHIWVAISVPLASLFVAKYFGFTLENVGVEVSTSPFKNFLVIFALPAGISFYTFQIVAYVIDVIEGKTDIDCNILKYGAFISFFPQLIAGPIIRHDQISDQFDRLINVKNITPNIQIGVRYFIVGLFYKTVFSDTLQPIREQFEIGVQSHWLDGLWSVFAYSAIIYFDFWGYSLMAIGIAKFVGLDIPVNFLEPYKSLSPKEFWKRWHVTLSMWLRDYVYFRLGGNQSYVRNILILFAAVGLWHGAGWNFIVWGLYHGIFVVAYHQLRRFWDKFPIALQIAATFAIISAGWPLFYLDLTQWLELLGVIASGQVGDGILWGALPWGWLGIIMSWIFLFKETRWLHAENCGAFSNPVLLGVMMALSIILFSFSRSFIYFRF